MSSMDQNDTVTNSGRQSPEFFRRFSLADIQSATNNFSSTMLIGRGGFGKVYKGFIDDGATIVAIKRLNPESNQGAREFWAEIKTLYKLRHHNLINLIGYSDDNKEMILIYECMTNGTLADNLYKNHRDRKGKDIYHLTWKRRLEICIGAARGLDYLHEGTTEQSVIHRDVKTTNILLDKNWVPKIADFGLSKMAGQTQTHVSTDVKGTFGYLDPQYFLTRRLTKKSDVYAFGVVLFEVLCGRPPVDFDVDEEQYSLAQWVQHCMRKGILAQIIDPSLGGQISTNSLKVFSEVANRCLHNHPKGRPTMAEVVRSLELALASEDKIHPPKGIISKVPLNIARFFVKSIEFGKEKLNNLNCKNTPTQSMGNPLTNQAIQVCRRFSLSEVQAATYNFDKHQLVGNNDYSTVYRGVIDGRSREVAIKRCKQEKSSEYSDIFNAEIQILSQLHHFHLISLIGYCIERHELITVYDYMDNGSLHFRLHHSNHDPLPWEKRLEICIGAARGMHYLHAGAKQPIIHRNLNSANILLDQNWVVKLCGLEFPTILPQDLQSTSFNPLLACTVGYMDPEYILNGRLSLKSDVYSFGVILLEILCDRQPMIYSPDANQVNLVQWFKTNMKMGTIGQIIDSRLIDTIAPECLREYIKLADSCTNNVGLERPAMENVLDTLRYAQQLQKTWSDQKQSGAMFSKANSHSHDLDQNPSQEIYIPNGILVVDTSSKVGASKTRFAKLDDSDYMSNNLAR